MQQSIAIQERTALRAALRLEITTVVWMAIEAAVAVGAGIVADSPSACRFPRFARRSATSCS